MTVLLVWLLYLRPPTLHILLTRFFLEYLMLRVSHSHRRNAVDNRQEERRGLRVRVRAREVVLHCDSRCCAEICMMVFAAV